jgi:hypothetical protein
MKKVKPNTQLTKLAAAIKSYNMAPLVEARNLIAETAGTLESVCKDYALQAKLYFVACGIKDSEVFEFNGNAKKYEGHAKVINDERQACKQALIDKTGMTKDSANTYMSRTIMPHIREAMNPKRFAKELKEKEAARAERAANGGSAGKGKKNKDKKPGQTVQVNAKNIGNISPALMVGFLQARIKHEQSNENPGYAVNEVIKGLNLAIAGFKKKVISK